jgi:hypothetical protein
MRLPMWQFGWLLYESYHRSPVVVTSTEISKRLGITYKSALNLKRRFQLYCAHQSHRIQQLFTEELKKQFNNFDLPHKRDTDITELIKDKTPVNIDSMALFSASQRANKGRARYRATGLTASIYLSDKIDNGRQVGSLFQSITFKQGPCILKSVPTQQATHIRPILDDYIPHRTVVFSDEGYRWIVNPNHRSVCHSAHSKDKRYKWSRNRWSKNGIHNNVAEGIQGSFKTAMRTYRYFKPEYSDLYATEWTTMKNIKYFGLDRLYEKEMGGKVLNKFVGKKYDKFTHKCSHSQPLKWFQAEISKFLYKPILLEERKAYSSSQLEQINEKLLKLPVFHQKQFIKLRNEMENYNSFLKEKNRNWKFYREKQNNYIAQRLWSAIPVKEWTSLNEIISAYNLPRFKCLRIAQRWSLINAVELLDYTEPSGDQTVNYVLRKRLRSLPELLYIQSKDRYLEAKKLFNRQARIRRKKRKAGRPKRFR